MRLTIGYSSCPNDTFIFDAMVNRKIDTGELDFEVVIEDVESLNRKAFDGVLDITKLSFPALFANLKNYTLLDSGSALGIGVGPLLITKPASKNTNVKPVPLGSCDPERTTIALPGRNTTANFLFSHAYPEFGKKRYMLFSTIEDAVLNEEVDYGVIIHENRFTYHQKGLQKVADLGAIWEDRMKLPIPLGGIAINRRLDPSIAPKVNELIRKSVEFSFKNYPEVSDYVKLHSQTMSEAVMRQHIDLYVNKFSIDLGDEGKNAVKKFYEVFPQNDIAMIENIFWNG